jgi:hypothetical protein
MATADEITARVVLTEEELECLVNDFEAVDGFYGGAPEPASADESGREKLRLALCKLRLGVGAGATEREK